MYLLDQNHISGADRNRKVYLIQISHFLVMKSLQLKLFRCLFQILKAIAGELKFNLVFIPSCYDYIRGVLLLKMWAF